MKPSFLSLRLCLSLFTPHFHHLLPPQTGHNGRRKTTKGGGCMTSNLFSPPSLSHRRLYPSLATFPSVIPPTNIRPISVKPQLIFLGFPAPPPTTTSLPPQVALCLETGQQFWTVVEISPSGLTVTVPEKFFEIFGSRSTMVSIRRRKLLGLYAGRSSFLSSLPRFCDNGNTPQNPVQNTKPVSVHPMPSVDAKQPEEISFQKTISKVHPGSSNASGSSTSKEQQNQQYPVPEVKRRKRHRRKHLENQEPCLMRGVYFKNMKWQAAIKVDKKQIHLGTVSSQEEAARLYDRAAFMCGREPNFELSEEEKQELRKFKWDEFLALTRSAITNKKHRRRSGGPGLQRKSEPSSMQNSDWEGEQGVNGFSASEDVEPDASVF